MNRTRGFVNLNRFKSAKAIKRHPTPPDKHKMKGRRVNKK
jgi:hypothetical protein